MKNNTPPQIAFMSERGWAVIGYCFSWCGGPGMPLPPVDCPVLDTTGMDADRVSRIINKYSLGPEGIRDVDALVADMVKAGATLTYAVEMPVSLSACSSSIPDDP